MGKFNDDYSWQDRWIPAIKKKIGPLLLDSAPLEQDLKEATDLIILRARDMRIACRVRRVGYLIYAREITIRSSRDSGAQTELSKLIEGLGDWMFYGHAHPDGEDRFAVWYVIDLDKLRALFIREGVDKVLGSEIPNGDGTCFRPLDILQFPSLIIAKQRDESLLHLWQQPPLKAAAQVVRPRVDDGQRELPL